MALNQGTEWPADIPQWVIRGVARAAPPIPLWRTLEQLRPKAMGGEPGKEAWPVLDVALLVEIALDGVELGPVKLPEMWREVEATDPFALQDGFDCRSGWLCRSCFTTNRT